MSRSVRSQLLHGVVWNFIEKVLVRGVTFAIGILLARLLSPSDFGLIGMLAIFIAISDVFIEGGFVKALIQLKNCSDKDYSTAFVTNVSVSIFIFILLLVFAPAIAAFYDEPILVPLTRVLSINIVIGSLNIVQRARLMANVDFKSIAQISVISTILGGGIGVAMAYTGYGVWSLLGQTIGSTIVSFFLYPIYSKWRPSLSFSFDSFTRLFGFGSNLMITGIVGVIVNNISGICIGRYYKSNQLGYYTKASHFSELVAFTVFDVLGNVTYPVLSGLQDERERMIAVYKRSLFFTAMIIFPIMVLFTLLARPLIIILLTEKWISCVVLMQWLFLARMFLPISAINMNVLNAIGRSDLYMKLDFSKIPLDLVILAITIPIGVEAITIGYFCNSFLCFFINAYLPGRILGYGCFQQLRDWKYIILSVFVMSLVVWIFLSFVGNVWIQLIGGAMLGLIVYTGCCLLFKVFDKEVLILLVNRKIHG